MKAKGIKSDVKVNGAEMSYTLTDAQDAAQTETLSFNLENVFAGFSSLSAIAQKALSFATRTRLRNETAGKTFDEAISGINDAIKELLAGNWTSARTSGGESKVSLLVQAIVIAAGGKYDNASAAELVNSKIAGAAQAAGIDPANPEEDDDVKAALTKIRAAVRKAFLDKPSVQAAYAKLQSDEATAKAARLAEKAQKAGEAAGANDEL